MIAREMQADIDRLRGLLAEVAASGVSFEDERVGYVEVQIDRDTWTEIAAVTATTGERP